MTASLRLRLTLVGTALLVVGLGLAAVAFDRILENQLVDNLDQTLAAQASDRVAALDQGLEPGSVLASVGRENAVAVFDTDGSVIASRGFDQPTEVADVTPGSTSTRRVLLVELGESEVERYEVRVAAATGDRGTVVVAAETELVDNSVGTVRRLLAIGIPITAAAGAALFWVVTGRALRPVERLRRDAASIVAVGDGGRVTDPARSDEIGRLAITLNDMLERLDASATTLRRFVSDASHEIRSPAAGIRARIETATSADLDVARRDIVGEVERMEAIVDDLTYLARSDEGRLSTVAGRVELDELLFAEARRLQQRGLVRADASGVEPVVVDGDETQLRRVVRNLVDNAERHADGVVALAVSVIDGDAHLRVDDDGPGIGAEHRRRVFERFARLDDARDRRSGGTGLGLAIVADIVRRHDGEVAVHDAPLGGARFEVRLPGSG